jgi:alpha-tubulin suppressor-like RCC1 family protein
LKFFADKKITQIAAGAYHSLFLADGDVLYGLGSGKYGENGCGDFVDVSTPK